MSGFTKGPWYVSPYKTSIGITSRPDGGYADRVAECDYWTPPRRGQPDRPEAEANALLIASAPDLLEAVIQYRDDLKRPPTGDSLERRLAMVNKVLAKALGEDA